MRKFIGGLCTLIVALEVLIGVPLIVCTVFYCAIGPGGPLVVEAHRGARPAATIPPVDYPASYTSGPLAAAAAPPRNVIPAGTQIADNPILQTRQVQGSPLAGTVLESCEEEDELFLTALVKAEEEAECTAVCAEPAACGLADCETGAVSNGAVSNPVQQLIGHLYAMADLDEQAGEYERADQWRGLARELRK